MIVSKLEKNDVLEATLLMDSTWDDDMYTYARDESMWIGKLIQYIQAQYNGDLNYVAYKMTNVNGAIRGFLLGNVFRETYSGQLVLDISDMIVDVHASKGDQVKTVQGLIDTTLEYCKLHDILHWRADTIHESKQAKGYIKFLKAKYTGEISYTFRGKI